MTYVWATEDAVGDWFDNPYIDGIGKVKVLRNTESPLGVWHAERVDLTTDFVEAFGYEPIQPAYIALSADTEDSGARGLSWIRDLRLTASDDN